MSDVSLQLHHIQQRIAQACAAANRPVSSVHLLAVSKTFDADAIMQAVHAGQLAFGENYVTEAINKIEHFSLQNPPLCWHMIGPLQSNKTLAVAQHFQWIHSLDRLKIAKRLNEQRPVELEPLQVCLEVNVSQETSKSGVAPQELKALAAAIATLPRLQLRGLMCIPEPSADFEAQRKPFALLKELFDELQKAGYPLDTLSMGMSDDLEAAIMEGSTLVRVGRGIFGYRALKPAQTQVV